MTYDNPTSHPFWELRDENGKLVTFPWKTKDFRGDPITIVGFRAPKHTGSTGCVITDEGAEYYPSIVNAVIV